MKLFAKSYHPPGTPPGTLATHWLAQPSSPLHVHLADYVSGSLEEHQDPSLEQITPLLESESRTWINVKGRPDAEWMLQWGQALKLHPLAQEDVLNGGQRPKMELYDGQMFIVLNVLDRKDDQIKVDQLYLFWDGQMLVSIFAGHSEIFEPILKRLRNSATRVRRQGLDYLVYSIIDLALDQAFPVMEQLGLEIEDLEDQITDSADQAMMQDIHQLKRQLVLIRRAIWPQRDVVNQLLRDEEDSFSSETRLYLRDCYDHSVEIMDLVESYREMSGALLDVYLSSVSLRMNDIMRVLTIIATIFIPLTFVAGIYGMNFSNPDSPWAMPELRWYYGYPLAWIIFLVLPVGMIKWFRRKGWL